MKRILYLLVIMSFSNLVVAQCQIDVRTTSFPPYYIIDNTNNYLGLEIELINALLKEANCQASFKKMPWKRGLQLLKISGVDLMAGMSISDQRKPYVKFIGPIRKETIVLLVPSNRHLSISSLDDLKHLIKPVGIVRGLYYGAKFAHKFKQDHVFKTKFYVANSTQNNLDNLLNQRLSAVVGDFFYIVHWLKVNKLTANYEIHPFYLNTDNVYFGISKRNVSTENMAKLMAANARLLNSGAYQQIIDQYKP